VKRPISFPIAGALAALLLPILLCGASPRHDVHISYCKADMTGRTLTGTVTIYRDDFIKALRNWKGIELHTLAGGAMLAAVTEFLDRHLAATADGRRLPLTIVSTGTDNASMRFTFSYTSASPIVSMTFSNTILFTEYGDQMNLMAVKTPKRDYNFIFTPSKPNGSLEL